MKQYVLILAMAVLLGACSKKVLKTFADGSKLRFEEQPNMPLIQITPSPAL